MASVHADTQLLHGQEERAAEEEDVDAFKRNNVFKCMANCTNAHKWMQRKEEENKIRRFAFMNLCENRVRLCLCVCASVIETNYGSMHGLLLTTIKCSKMCNKACPITPLW